MYSYTYNHLGYTVYKDGKPIRAAGILNKNKRYSKANAKCMKESAEATIRLLIAMDNYEKEREAKNND